MSENTPETTAPAPAPVNTIDFGHGFAWDHVLEQHTITKRGKGADGKAVTNKVDHPVVAPVVKDLAAILGYTAGVFNTVEARGAGNAVKLFAALFGDRIRNASDESFDFAKQTDDTEKYVELTLQVERPRSAGLKIDEINSRLAALTPEYMALVNASNSTDGWQTVLSPETGAPAFDSVEAFGLRLSTVISEMTKLITVRQEKEKKSLEVKAKREEKARKQAEAVKAAAATAPAPEPAH